MLTLILSGADDVDDDADDSGADDGNNDGAPGS